MKQGILPERSEALRLFASTKGEYDNRSRSNWGLEVITQNEVGAPKRTLGPFNILAAAFNICQAWAAIGATFALGIAHGGSPTIIYGLILILVVYSAIALSMAEMVARFPTSSGQYHWTAIMAPESVRRELVFLPVVGKKACMLNIIAELCLRFDQYNRMDLIDRQCCYNPAADYCRGDQILQLRLCDKALARFSLVSSPKCLVIIIQYFRTSTFASDTRYWMWVIIVLLPWSAWAIPNIRALGRNFDLYR